MNTFFEYIQPTIIKAKNNKLLPENLRNKFFVNFNVFGIKYFIEKFILSENENGSPYLIQKEDQWNFLLEDSVNETLVVDIPRLYIPITDKFIEDPEGVFQSFVYQATMQNSIYAVGIDNFKAGEDYYLNTTLYNYLANSKQITTPNFGARLPNYLDDDNDDNIVNIKNEYWDDLINSPLKDYRNLEYYSKRNKLLDNTYSEDELNNFYANFCKIILDNTEISDDVKAEQNNQIYNLVLNYYANYQSDSISTALNLVLNTLYSTSTSTSCGCNSSSLDISGSTTSSSCADMYAEAMPLYLQQMLADNEFYNDWFTIPVTETGETIPNDVLCDKLILFIDEFKELEYELNFDNDNSSDCDCGNVTTDSSDCNYKTINNYLKVLNWAKNDEINTNINKTKIFGKQFALILPSMQF